MSLRDDFKNATSDPLELATHQFPLFERYLAPFRNRPCVMFLIAQGNTALAQARLWACFLGSAAKVVGITDWEGDDHQVSFRCGSLSDPHLRRRLILEFGVPSLVMDDGRRSPTQVIETLESVQPLLSAGGLHMIENLRAGYENHPCRNSLADYIKAMVDELHAPWTHGVIPPNGCSAHVAGIHVHPDLIIIEAGRLTDRRRINNQG